MSLIDSYYRTALVLIFAHLEIRDLGRIARVSKQWKEIASYDEVWKNRQLDDKTPSPIKQYTVSWIQEAIPFFKKMKEMPEKLPDYTSEIITIHFSTNDFWERTDKKDLADLYLEKDIKQIDQPIKVLNLFSLVVKTFNLYIQLNKTGFTNLDDAEKLALKTKDTFRNLYPFIILREEYMKAGLTEKANEMKNTILSMTV